jgi:hypothetical protein
MKTGFNTGLAKVEFIAPQRHLWLIKVWFYASIRQLTDDENCHLRQARNRYTQPYGNHANIKLLES